MHYYNISLLGSPLEPFTYCSNSEIKLLTKVSIDVRNRTTDGVVIERVQKPEFKTNEVLSLSEFFYSQKQLELARFISTYYICSLGEALGIMMPFSCISQDEVKTSLPEERQTVMLKGSDALASQKSETEAFRPEIEEEMARYGSDALASQKHEVKTSLPKNCQFGSDALASQKREVKTSLPEERQTAMLKGSDALASQKSEVETSLPEERQTVMLKGSDALASQKSDLGASLSDAKSASKIKLSQKQEEALEFLKQHQTSLLFGDTGSGKTEIYMKYFEQMIAQNRRSIFLMPEISLTPQMDKRLQAHFGGDVVMWHSKLTPLQKKKALVKIYDGSAKIVAGPRSALFLPIKDLGLIVVDEEHDDSYKSSSRPRYHARDLGIYMGKLYGAEVVLGSATPSLSSYVKFPHTRLKGTHFSAKKEFIYEKSKEELSPLIFEQIKKALDAKEQVIVFLPTRANFKYLVCESCGASVECVFCSVGMSIHEKSNALKCHYCNYTQAIPNVCTKCGSGSLISSRLGTAEALRVIQEKFSEVKVELFDRDAITSAKKLRDALERFNTQETSILVGTQMLSKGHDYHGVTLAVVLGLDNMLNMSDYRARQNALSSLIQVSGRSGRAKDAKVLVQTFIEEFFSKFIDNYDAFLQEEIGFREGLYPPYKKLCRILFSHKNGTKAQDEMHQMLGALSRFKDIEIVGFGKCAVERVADKYRFEILLRSDKSTNIIRAIKSCKVALAEVDMDPIEFS